MQHLFCYASEQDEIRIHDAEGHPLPGKQGSCQGESCPCGRKTEGNEALRCGKKLQDGIEETLTYMDFPTQHWSRIRTNNTIERLNREIKHRTKAIGAFPDGQSALMSVCARLRHVAGTQWGAKRYMNMDHLHSMAVDNESDNIAG